MEPLVRPFHIRWSRHKQYSFQNATNTLLFMHGYTSSSEYTLALQRELQIPSNTFCLHLSGPIQYTPQQYSWFDYHIDAERDAHLNTTTLSSLMKSLHLEANTKSLKTQLDRFQSLLRHIMLQKKHIGIIATSQGAAFACSALLGTPSNISAVFHHMAGWYPPTNPVSFAGNITITGSKETGGHGEWTQEDLLQIQSFVDNLSHHSKVNLLYNRDDAVVPPELQHFSKKLLILQ